ncbi:MAG TPA: alpha/beta hydrolase [Solirubrobacteraceae bacterium]|nr:alpha/beta hydrolase [Solirubrobacteraceae bacterium]
MASSPQTQAALDAYGPVGRSEWQDVDWQQHLRWVRVQDRWMNLVDIGEGPVILMIHGLSGSWQNWLENIPFFARDHRVIAVDLPGFGESEMPVKDISISNYADTIDALLDVLEIETVRLVGNSMGGFIGAELAIRYPARIERLVLVSAAGLSVETIRTQRQEGLRHRAENIAFFNIGWLASRSPAITRRRRLRSAIMLLVSAHPDRLPPELTFEQVKGSGKPGFNGALEALCCYPIRTRLGEIACPTFIVWGDKDRLVPVKDASVFEELIDDARKVVYKDTGHLSMLERPARFNADVHEFLQEQPGERKPEADTRSFAT